jgi:hypothetical protein
MAKNSIRDYSATVGSNTDIQSVNIDEGCSPAGINNAIREMMVDLANVNSGAVSLVSPDFDTATINSVAIDAFPAGTKMLFNQTTAPTGWTKDTTHNDKALRITNGTVGTGGSVAFETAFASQTPAGTVAVTVAGHALSISEMPTHSHFTFESTRSSATLSGANLTTENAPFQQHRGQGSDWAYLMADSGAQADVGKSSDSGGDAEHTHTGTGTFTGTAIDLDVQYVDVIIASKD